MVFGESLALIAAGLALGLPCVFAVSRVVSGILFDVKANDPVLVSMAAVALSATAGLTAYFPARRASRISPMAALRYE
jgi:ABC-type antimicrobial peptide transport system permease subunit